MMTARQRILTIRLFSRIAARPEYAGQLGIQGVVTEVRPRGGREAALPSGDLAER